MEATGVGARRLVTDRSRFVGAVLVCLTAIALIAVPASPSFAAEKVPGIDVSKWQGDVDWSEVASTSVRYVIMRATIGNSAIKARFVDPKYEEYLAGATANGLVVGAYHRANVGTAENDATSEANFFVNNAQIAAGDVLPVLDIEQTHGLSVDQMRDWVREWVQRVLARTGVKPMIYTSPNFWATSMGGTPWFADHGYPLWIADWRGNPAPEVPAGNWGGYGWTFWQWTSTGHVAGIDTDVDRDRFNGTGLARGRIASLEVTPPVGGSVTGARIDCGGGGSTCTRLANPDTVLSLAATPDPGATLLGWTGACGDAGTAPTCDVPMRGAKTVSAQFGFPVEVAREGSGAGTVTSSPTGLDCGATCTALFAAGSTVTLTAEADSASTFTGWSGGCAGTDPVCSLPVASPTAVAASFESVIGVEEDGAGARYAWGRSIDPDAIGGSYRWERRTGASVGFAFSGGGVTIFTVSGPVMGKARIRVDGAAIATFDGYAPTTTAGVKRRFENLGPGQHLLTVDVLGTKRAAAVGTRVAIDALRWGGRTRPDPPGLAVRWGVVSHASASGGAYAISDVRDAVARLAFTGTGVSLRTLRGPSMGKAEIWLDGGFVRVIDLFAPTSAFVTLPLASGLADGPHTVRLVVLRTHRPSSAGSSVVVDRWLVI
jgi:GH25 family lysozyme M1 (1,4-beta-N-acetylmuramidase)